MQLSIWDRCNQNPAGCIDQGKILRRCNPSSVLDLFTILSDLNGSNIMSHDDFVLGYQNGGLGCSVSTLLILRLFLVGRIRETRIVIPLVRWSLGALLLIGLTIIGFLFLPPVWALFGTFLFLLFFSLTLVYQSGSLPV